MNIMQIIIPGQGVGEKDEEDVTTALTIDVPKVGFFLKFAKGCFLKKLPKVLFILQHCLVD